MKKTGIYKITSPSGRIYIGSEYINNRKSMYKNLLCINQSRLYMSLQKYGWDLHIFEIVEECEVEKLLSLERAWGDFYEVLGPKGLNCKLPRIDEKQKCYTEETRNKMSESAKNRLPMSEETKKKISETLRGHIVSEETRVKIKVANSNPSKEKRENMSKAQKGRLFSEAHLKNLTKSLRGRKFSDEARINMKNNSRKKVLNIVTGEEYISVGEAAKCNNYNAAYLGLMLFGSKKNTTNLIYV